MSNNSSEEEKLIIDIDEIRKNAGKRLDSKEDYDLNNNKSNPNRDSISNININIYIYSKYDLTAFDIPFKEFATFLFYNYIVAIYQLDEEQD